MNQPKDFSHFLLVIKAGIADSKHLGCFPSVFPNKVRVALVPPSVRLGDFRFRIGGVMYQKKNAYLDINPEMSVSCASLADHLWSGTWDSDGFTARSSSI